MTTATTQPLIGELHAEAQATRRLLDRVPSDRLAWRPHPKSMSLGQLALHVAQVPGRLSDLLARDGFDAAGSNFEPAQPSDRAELSAALDESLRRAEAFLSGLDEESLHELWAMTNGGQPVFARPRAELIRAMIFNHWYHHRGQLTVYLRLLDVPLPVTYGRSADESGFAR